MNNSIKRKYKPCRLDVVEFKVERGFATSVGQDFDRTEITNQQGVTNILWSMVDDGNGNFRNMESYSEEVFDW